MIGKSEFSPPDNYEVSPGKSFLVAIVVVCKDILTWKNLKMQIFSQLCCHISLDYPCNSTAPWECSPVSPEQLLLQLPTGSEGQCPVRHYAVGKFLPVHKSSQIHIEFGSPFLAQVLQTSKVQVSKTFKLSSYLFHRPIVTDASSAACSFSDCG